MITVKKVSIKKETNVNIEFGIIQNGNDLGLLIVISGDYGLGSIGNDNGNYIGSMISAALFRWRVRYLVLDCTNMIYEMSNSIRQITDVIKKNRSPNYQTYIVVSDKNIIGIRSYISRLGSNWNIKVINNLNEIYSAQQGDAPEPES